VRPPGAAGNDPSRHTTVYGCRIEGKEEAGMIKKTVGNEDIRKENNSIEVPGYLELSDTYSI
jgi:hypothetical protein